MEQKQDSSEDREVFKNAAREASWEVQSDCPTCGSEGLGPVTGRVVHSYSPSGIGADWDLDHLLAAIDKATQVEWIQGFSRHNLAVEVDGAVYQFEVPRAVAS